MKTIKKVEVFPVFVEYVPDNKLMKEQEIYISREYKTAVHLCLCGCKNLTVTPLNKTGWNMLENDGKITLIPSIGNYSFDCKSHYIITNNIANFV